ncbi:alpha-ketoglutarate-dependent dioxygenase alkB homolog 7, mitochondrial isoform X1 [Pogona vitticeps]
MGLFGAPCGRCVVAAVFAGRRQKLWPLWGPSGRRRLCGGEEAQQRPRPPSLPAEVRASSEALWQRLRADGASVVPGFLSEAEEALLAQEVEPHFRRRRYEDGHWDGAIHKYRETEKSHWSKESHEILQRVRDAAFPPGMPQLTQVHVLDLHKSGYIKPHVDSVKFCGCTIAGLSLLSSSVMHLVSEQNPEDWLDLLLERRSLYILSCLSVDSLPRKDKLALCFFSIDEKLQGPIIIFTIGGPGSGKGLQSRQMAQKYNFSHVAIGDLLRVEASRANRRGRAIRDIMLKGALVPSGYIVDLLINNMLKANSVKGFIIEGFPRDVNQAKLFEEVVGRSPNIVIVFDCCTETMIQRLMLRSQMGERVDDHERIIRQRLQTHYTQCELVLTYYLQKSLLRNIIGEEPPDTVFTKCCSVVDEVIKTAALTT